MVPCANWIDDDDDVSVLVGPWDIRPNESVKRSSEDVSSSKNETDDDDGTPLWRDVNMSCVPRDAPPTGDLVVDAHALKACDDGDFFIS